MEPLAASETAPATVEERLPFPPPRSGVPLALHAMRCRWFSRLPHHLVHRVLQARFHVGRLRRTPQFQERRRLLAQVVPEAASTHLDRLTTDSLVSCFWQPWRALCLASHATQGRSLVVHGLDILRELQCTGRGVILLNSHFAGGRAVPLLLNRLGFHDILSREVGHTLREAALTASTRILDCWPESADARQRETRFLSQIYEMRNTLRAGGMVHTTGDGRQGARGPEMTFLGKRVRFPSSFARLAVDTAAAVVPVFAILDGRGRLELHLHEPLAGEQTGSLLLAYVALLERYWKLHPENIVPQTLRLFTTWPAAVG